MAYGLDDFARLGSDPVEQWYRSTIPDFDGQQNGAPEETINRLFGSVQFDQNLDRLDDDEQTDAWSAYDAAAPVTSPQSSELSGFIGSPSTSTIVGYRNLWNNAGCASCHGYPPGAMPPPLGGASPFPPSVMPRVGSGAGSSPQPPDKYPQCEMQEQKDRGICAQQPTTKAKAVCNESAFQRRVWCDKHAGEIGTPRLVTAYRKSGRPWP